MTAGRRQSTSDRPTRRIIERPRLLRLLDSIDARTILLVAPAGYGKTTLARQWARTLRGVVWVTATRSHRDVVTFTEDVASGIDACGGNASAFIGEYLRARSNPQREAQKIAGALAGRMEAARIQWLVVDDYHVLEGSEVEDLVERVRNTVSSRVLVASRCVPVWATPRRSIYGEIATIGSAELALTPEETTGVIGRRPDLDALVRKAAGWPAVIALASGLDAAGDVESQLPESLFEYVADELYRSESEETKAELQALALLPGLQPQHLRERFREGVPYVIGKARRLGFITDEEPNDLHPFLKEFLLSRVRASADADEQARAAVAQCLEVQAWDRALDLVCTFDLHDLVEPVLEVAFKPLARHGMLGTLSAFASYARTLAQDFSLAAVDLIDAEAALSEGQFGLASQLASRAQARLPAESPLASRCGAILGLSFSFLGDFASARPAFQAARATALDPTDEAEALHGLAVSSLYEEQDDPTHLIDALTDRRHWTTAHLLRFTTAELVRRRYEEGLGADLPLAEPLHALGRVNDPRVRTSFTYMAATHLILRSDYQEATRFLHLLAADVSTYDIDFALPYAAWTAAALAIGLRRFGDADREIQRLEDMPKTRDHGLHAINARILRARLLLQTGQAEAALAVLQPDDQLPPTRAWRAEYAAMRAFALSCVKQNREARKAAEDASGISKDVETRVLLAAARSVVAANEDDSENAAQIIQTASAVGVWDPVVTALRSSQELFVALSAEASTRPRLSWLWAKSNDFALARRAGLRQRSTRLPDGILTPRELEILGLMAQGFRNREIAAALYIAESTVKVHVRHILERLGVRSRAEAVARYERSAIAASSGDSHVHGR